MIETLVTSVFENLRGNKKAAKEFPGVVMVLSLSALIAYGCKGLESREGAGEKEQAPLVEATESRIQGDFSRLKRDIPRALRECGWALVYLREREADGDPPSANGLIWGRGLVPDGRIATIKAWWQEGEAFSDKIAIAIQVGHFGDRAMQQKFISALSKILQSRPPREYGGNFQLPH